jgi:hypothetical protein
VEEAENRRNYPFSDGGFSPFHGWENGGIMEMIFVLFFTQRNAETP